jgi:hypothetical protein
MVKIIRLFKRQNTQKHCKKSAKKKWDGIKILNKHQHMQV